MCYTAIFTQIIYSAANLSYSTDSFGHYYADLDLMATDTPNNLLFSQGNIFVVYDTTIFGSNMVSRGAITATRGTIDSFYTLSLSDSTPNILKLTLVHDSTNHLTNLDSVNTNAQLCHLRINISSFNLTSVTAYFDTLAMASASLYQSTPNGVALPYDRVLVSGLVGALRADDLDAQITNVNYTSSSPEYLTFDVQIQADAPLYDATVTLAYNTANFGSSPTLTCTLPSGLGIYSLSPSASSGAISLALSGSSSYPTEVLSDSLGTVGTFPVPNDFTSYTTIASCSLTVVSCCYTSGAYLSTTSVTGDYAYRDGSLQDDGSGDYWYDITDAAYATTGVSGSYDNNSSSICSSTPNITNVFGPDGNDPMTLTAGTFCLLTIQGSGFGCDTGQVLFTNTQPSFSTFMHSQQPDIQSWSDNEVKVWVPSVQNDQDDNGAGSGPVQVQTASGSISNASSSINIPYSASNIRASYTDTRPVYLGMQNQNSSGGYTFTPDQLTVPTSPAAYLPAITEAMNDWKCEIGVQFTMGAGADITGGANPNDGINSITFDTTSYSVVTTVTPSTTICTNSNGNLIAIANDIDLVFSSRYTFDSATFSTPNATGFNTTGLYSLLGVARLGFGYAVLLDKVLNTADLMSGGALGIGVDPPVIHSDDHNGGVYILTDVGPNQSGGCFTYSPQLYPDSCPNSGFTNGISPIANNAFDLSVYPDPFDNNVTIHAVLGGDKDVKVMVYDVLGQMVSSVDLGQQSGETAQSIPLSSLSSGLYIIQVAIDEQLLNFKIVKK